MLDYRVGPAGFPAALLRRHDSFYLAILTRGGSSTWRGEARLTERFVGALRARFQLELLLERRIGGAEVLRIWRVTGRR